MYSSFVISHLGEKKGIFLTHFISIRISNGWCSNLRTIVLYMVSGRNDVRSWLKFIRKFKHDDVSHFRFVPSFRPMIIQRTKSCQNISWEEIIRILELVLKRERVNTAAAFEPFYQCLILHSFLPKILKIFSLLIYYTTKPAFK